MLIVFSGLDGAGKSTQIDLLKERLSSRDLSVKVIWARGGYTPGFELLKKILRRIAGKKIPPAGPSLVRDAKLKKSSLQKLWLTIALVDLILIWAFYVRFLQMMGFVIICDRYINDTLLDFRRNFPSSGIEKSLGWWFLKLVIPKPNKCFLFLIPVETSIKRSIEKSDPFPDDQDTLVWRLESYVDPNIFPEHEYIRVNGQSDISRISDDIHDIITLVIDKG